MDLSFTPEDLAFQKEVRDWISENYTDELKYRNSLSKNGYLDKDGMLEWQRKLDEKGWFVINWPEEFGGPGLSSGQRYILNLEMAAAGTPQMSPMGKSMVAPVIMAFGNDAQKAEHLPKIKRSEIWWCQGYSEPGSGSDLASLQMSAVRDGDEYVLNGSKIWTTQAQWADWIFCLVRTDNTGKKHHGISFVLFDMATPGVEARPIKLISGRSPFCETFFDDASVPKSYGEDCPGYVGEINRGWDVAKYLLGHEREMISGADGGNTGTLGAAMSRHAGELDPILRADLADFDVDALAGQIAATVESSMSA